MTSVPSISYNIDGHVIIDARRGFSHITFMLSPDVAEQLAADMVENARKARNIGKQVERHGIDGRGYSIIPSCEERSREA